jgi:hypothetical protein
MRIDARDTTQVREIRVVGALEGSAEERRLNVTER